MHRKSIDSVILIMFFIFSNLNIVTDFKQNTYLQISVEDGTENDDIFTLISSKQFDKDINLENIVNSDFKAQIQKNWQNNWQKLQNNPYKISEIEQIVKSREITLAREAPHILSELQDLALSLGMPYQQVLILNLFNELNEPNDDGCTSWVSAGTANKNNETLLHKNRDYDYDAQIVVKGNEAGKYSYTAFVTASNPTGVAAGINEHGLAIVNNLISTTDVVLSGIGNLHMNRLVLEECKTVEEVSAFIDTKDLNSGVIFLVADKEKGAIFEVKASARSTLEQALVVNDVAYRANQFVTLTGSGTEGSSTSFIRYNAAKDLLDARKGNLTILDSFELSRHHYLENDQPDSKFNRPDGSISNYHTLFGVTFQIFPNYTKDLSMAWVAMNHPCSSVYIPVHIAATEISEYITTSAAYDASKALFANNLGPWAGVTPYFLNQEKQMMLEEEQLRSAVIMQLDAGNTTMAFHNLTTFDLQKADLMKNEMKQFSTEKFWYDGFATLEGIASTDYLNVKMNNVSLAVSSSGTNINYNTEGEITTRVIKSDNWENAILSGDLFLPENTTIEFKILNSNSEELLSISAAEFEAGYNLTSITVDEIILSAKLSTSNSNQTPTLIEWKIFGLEGERDTGTFWENIPYYYWYIAIAIVGVLFLCCCCCGYRKYKKNR